MTNQSGDVCDALFIKAADRRCVVGTSIFGRQVLQAIEIAAERDVVQAQAPVPAPAMDEDYGEGLALVTAHSPDLKRPR